MNPEYDAFVSYSHESDREFAPALKAGVEKLAKPWNRLRALRLFLDTASLSADPALWSSIERALERSSWFVLITSTSAARSPWVERELAWWLEHRSVERLLLVVTDGELAWAGDGFDPARSTALPRILRTAFAQEPRWVDTRETDPIAEVAATLRGIPKDELVGEAVRQHRRTMRVARGAIAALATLLALAVVAAIIALGQRNTAREQARIATARQLASVSTRELTSNLDVALLLAVKAHETDPSPQTRSALLQAATASPALVRYLPAGGEVTAVAGSTDQTTIVAGLQDGRVQRWTLPSARRDTLMRLSHEPASLAVSRDGRVVAAADSEQGAIWRRGEEPLKFPAYSIGLSPSGRTAVVRQGGIGESARLVVVDVAGGRPRSFHPAALGEFGSATEFALSDEQVLLTDGAGNWERRGLRDWTFEGGSSIGFGAHQAGSGPSADGRFLSASNGLSSIPVWRTKGVTDINHAPLTAEAPIATASSPVFSPDGSKLAVPDSGVIYVARVARAGTPREAPVELTGPGRANFDAVAFAGDNRHLVSATRDKVVLWDLAQLDRLAETRRTPVGAGCNACDGPTVAVSPDGRRAFIVDAYGDGAVIQPLSAGARPSPFTGDLRLDLPVWAADSRRLAFPQNDTDGTTGDLPPDVYAWPASDGDSSIARAALGGDGRSVIVVSDGGRIDIRDYTSGEVTGSMRSPVRLGSDYERLDSVAIHAAPDLVAMVYKGAVTIAEPRSRRVVGHVAGPGVTNVAYAGSRLLVQREAGPLEVWDLHGAVRERVVPGDATYTWPPIGDRQGKLVARRRTDGLIGLGDLQTGTTLALLRAPGNPLGARTSVAFSPDGRRLIAVTALGGEYSVLVQRDLSDAALIRSACATAGRDLTADEWRDFVGTSPPADLRCG